MRALRAASLLVALCACGGGNSASGTVEGATLSVKDGLSFRESLAGANPDGGSIYLAGFALTDQSGTCSIIAANRDPPNASVLSVEVADVQPIAAFSYPIRPLTGTLNFALAAFAKSNATCHSIIGETAISGSVTFSSVSSSQASGTFDLTFPDAGHLTGSFSAPDCAAFDAQLQSHDAGSPTCG
jgi:hypothetical protein